MTLTENFIREAIHLDAGAEVVYGSDQMYDTYPCRFPTVEFQLAATDALVEVADRIRMEKGYLPTHPRDGRTDGNKTNNAVSNLEWCTGSDNQLHNRRILKRICGKKHKPVICLETGICYETAHHAARDMGLNPAGIYYVCEGKNKHTHGLHFSYI